MNEDTLQLIRDYLDDRIGAEDLNTLNQLLETDAEARAEFRAMATMEEGLRDLSITSDIHFQTERATSSPERKSKKSTRRWFRAEPMGIAALLIVCFGLTLLLIQNTDREDEWGDALAKIESLSEDIRFNSDHQLPNSEGDLLGKGWILIERGRAEIQFKSGAIMEAEGPAAIGIDTPMRAFLDFGKVAVYAPESARDFVVATESMEVVDLGTRFEVAVDLESRESNVSVIEGLVDLHLGSRGTERKIQPLDAGSAARVDAFGKIVEITNEFASRQKSEEESPQLFGSWSFDELNAEGIVEDSTENQLDGLFANGTPSNLVPGVSGKALRLSSNEFVDLSEHVSKLDQLRDFSVTAWVRDPRKPLAMLFSLSGESEQQRVQFLLFPQHIDFGWQNGPHYDAISGRVDGWERGRWYHVAMTLRNNQVRLYRDGELIASGSVGSRLGMPVSNPSTVKNASHAYLGRLEDGRQGDAVAHQGFEGHVDAVQIYAGALERDRIRFLFEQTEDFQILKKFP